MNMNAINVTSENMNNANMNKQLQVHKPKQLSKQNKTNETN